MAFYECVSSELIMFLMNIASPGRKYAELIIFNYCEHPSFIKWQNYFFKNLVLFNAFCYV